MPALTATRVFVLDSDGAPGTLITSAPTQKRVDAEFKGHAAHAGIAPELGRSAVVAAARAVAAMRLGRLDDETTANIGVIRGGTARNVVAERCLVSGEARSRDEAKVAAQTEHMVQAIAAEAAAAGIDVEIDVQEAFRGYRHAPDSPLLVAGAEAARHAGLEPRLAEGGGGSDANVFNAHGLPGAHAWGGVRARPLAPRVHERAAAARAVRHGRGSGARRADRPRSGRGRRGGRPAKLRGAGPRPAGPGVPRLHQVRARPQPEHGERVRPRPRARSRPSSPAGTRRPEPRRRTTSAPGSPGPAGTARPPASRAARRRCAPSTPIWCVRACARTIRRRGCARPKRPQDLPRVLSVEEVEAILATVVPTGPLGPARPGRAGTALRVRPAGERAARTSRRRRRPRGRPRALRGQGRQGAGGADGLGRGQGRGPVRGRRAADPAPRPPPSGAHPQRARRPADAAGVRLHPAARARARRHARRGQRAHVPPLVRDAPAGGRRGPAQRPGDAGARQRRDHPVVHSRHRRPPSRGVPRDAPAGAAAQQGERTDL